MLQLTVESCLRMTRQHDWFLAEHERAVAESLQHGGEQGVQQVQTSPGFKPRSGKLQKATKAKVVRTSGGRLLKMSNSKPYAAAIDKGAKPHVIRAKRMGGRLKFRAGGRVVYARAVRHPGNKPYRFLARATMHAANKFENQFERRMSAIAARF
jgi:hypothetical protein